MNRSLIFFIWMYQRLKPFLNLVLVSVFGYVSVCHQTPSCSTYAQQQLRKHDTITAFRLIISRVKDCHSLPSMKTIV